MQAAIEEARLGLQEGGIPKVVIGENQTFMGGEALLRSQGVELQVLQDNTCIELMRHFIASKPELWNEDIGEQAHSGTVTIS